MKKHHTFSQKGEESVLRHIVPQKTIMLLIYGKCPRESHVFLNNTGALLLQTT